MSLERYGRRLSLRKVAGQGNQIATSALHWHNNIAQTPVIFAYGSASTAASFAASSLQEWVPIFKVHVTKLKKQQPISTHKSCK